MVSCNVLTRWANNLECQMNLMGFVCVLSNWRNKFQIQCSERRVFLHGLSIELFWYKVLTTGRSLLSNPFNSTSVAFVFWFLVWFACILAFSFELRVDALLKLTFGCFDCFVRRLFPLLCLPFAVVYFFLPRFQYRNWNFMNRIAVRGLQFLLIKKPIYHLANQSFPTKSWNLAPSRENLSRENHFLCLQNHFGRWNAPPRGTPLFLESTE